MTGQLLFMAAMGVLLGVCGGYPWGRILRRRDADAIWDEAYDDGDRDGYERCEADRFGIDDVPRTSVDGYLVSDGLDAAATVPGRGGGLPSLAGGPPHDWREQVAAELAPEALALENVPEPGPLSPLRSSNDGPGETLDSPGLGHPSPYAGRLTPAQRRRDKHKQRGQYAALPGWTADPDHVLASHWKPEGDRWVAEWRIEWQDDVAAVDEEIAAWTERARLWLAADRWDRGARRLGAVA